MSPPTLSVVISCRNEARWLPSMLASLHRQQIDGWVDTIVVDDGSTDGTHEVAAQAGAGLPGLRILRTEPVNRAAAANAGLAASVGEAVVFLDGDDEVAPGYLAALRAALADHDFVAARIDHQALNTSWQRAARPPEQSTELRSEPGVAWPVAGGGTIAVRRDVLTAVDGFDEGLVDAQDTDLCWRLAGRGVELTFVPDAVLRYRYRETARQVFGQARHYGRGRAVLEHRYGPRPSRLTLPRRAVKLGLQVLVVPFCVRRSLRFATAFRAGILLGWIEATLLRSSTRCDRGGPAGG